MNKEYTVNRERQQIKGVFVFQAEEDVPTEMEILMKDLNCTILKQQQSRIFIRTSRANLHSIKNRWGSGNVNDPMAMKLQRLISQIIIGGTA